MTKQTYPLVTGLILLAIAIVHGLRLIFGWDVSIDGHHAPTWASWIAVIIAGFLSYSGLSLWRRSSKEG